MRVFHEPVGQLAHMHQPVLMHPDINKSAKGRHVGHRALQQHPGLQVPDLIDTFRESGGPELWPRIAPGLFQLRQNVLHRRQPKAFLDKLPGIKPAQNSAVPHDRPNVPPAGRHDFPCHIIGFRVDAAGIKRLCPAPDPQEPRRLLVGFGPKTRHFQQVLPGLERPIGIPVCHDRSGQPGRKPRNPRQQGGRGGVQLYPHRVHGILDHLTKAAPQTCLVHIMLILADPNRLGFDLDQLCQRVLQAPRDADRAAQTDVQIRKLLRGQL